MMFVAQRDATRFPTSTTGFAQHRLQDVGQCMAANNLVWLIGERGDLDVALARGDRPAGDG
jgi:hypothetical protein